MSQNWLSKTVLMTVGSAVAWVLSIHLATAVQREKPQRAPEFTHKESIDWLNSKPLRLLDLRGQVVLIDFWAFECWNCYRSFPWLNEVDEQYKEEGLTIIGVHSPEFKRERNREMVAKKVVEFGLEHPVMIDNDFSYWTAMQNRYWPAFYLIDKKGRIRAKFFGETHAGDTRAKRIETWIERLLAEPA